MYIPHPFQMRDHTENIAFMKQYSFATIVSVKEQVPIATQLPFVIDDRSDKLILSAHFAAANEQARYIVENTSLVIFSEPHAYISPKHYDKQESVPTWDYIAVHAYGKAKIITDDAVKLQSLEKMIHFYEKEYMQQWQSLSEKFKQGMIKGIVAFELEVNELQGQKKLSQNKTDVERQRIVEQLEKSDNTAERDIATYIKKI